MIHAILPPGAEERPLPFYLAMEEHLARNYTGDYFFMWQVSPTVIIGRCQNPYTEVNLDYCRSHNIAVCRRKSGGGCVYADPDNIMLSVINSASGSVSSRFADYCHTVAATLRHLGIDATVSGRNDICIDSRKVSGNAFYALRGRNILHGTMLFDADPDTMTRAITPTQAKLSAKGVDSVRSRITTVREHLPGLSAAGFMHSLADALCDSRQMMTPDDIAEIERICAAYLTDEWLYGRYSSHPRRQCRIEGVGEFSVSVGFGPARAPGCPPTVSHIDLQGDFFLLRDLDEELLDHLRGVEYTRDAIAGALAGTDVADIIPGLSDSDFINLIIS